MKNFHQGLEALSYTPAVTKAHQYARTDRGSLRSEPSSKGRGNRGRGFGTPASNTGLNYQDAYTAHLDTLSGVHAGIIAVQDARAIIDEYERLFDDTVTFYEDVAVTNGCRWDGYGVGAVRGLRFWWNRPVWAMHGKLMVSIPGRALSYADKGAVRALITKLHRLYPFKANRFDAALDDYEKQVSLEEVEDAAKARNFAHVRDGIVMEAFGGKSGKTVYFGGTKSDKRLRIYDKTAESDGKIDAIRWEVQYRRHKANEAFQRWLVCENEPRLLASLVIGAVDFVDKSSKDHHVSRLPRLLWWNAMIFAVGEGVRIPSPIAEPSLQKSIKWLERAVAPTMAIIQRAHPKEFPYFIEATLKDATDRFTSKHRAIAELLSREEFAF